MKHFIAVIIYENGSPLIRRDYQMPNVSVSEYDFDKVCLVSCPGKMPEKDSVYCWQWVEPENEKEKQTMIETGKWHTIKIDNPQTNNTHINESEKFKGFM